MNSVVDNSARLRGNIALQNFKTEEKEVDYFSMTDTELLFYGTRKPKVTPLENELLHRLEQYIEHKDSC